MDALGINLGFFIAQIVNFLIVFLLLWKGVWPKVTKMLDERAERIAQGLEDARAAEEKLANAEREREEVLHKARAEGQKFIEEARQRAEEQAKQILAEARADADRVRAQAREQAEEERNRILTEAREDIVALAMAAAERLVGVSLDEAKQREIIHDFFTSVPPEVKGLGAEVTVISAVPLTEEEKAQIQKAIGAEAVEYQVDPSILGGLVLRAGDKVVDASARGDLTALAQQLQ